MGLCKMKILHEIERKVSERMREIVWEEDIGNEGERYRGRWIERER